MNKRFRAIKTKIFASYRRKPIFFMARLLVLLAIAYVLLTKRSIWTPDTLLLIVVFVGVAFNQTREFIRRFVPFLGLLLVYDMFRGVADDLNKNVHFTEMINFDRWITFGTLPTSWLQAHLYTGQLHWYDFYFYFLYTLHFLMPVIAGIILWKWRPKMYWPFVWVMIGVSFAAFITYILFPAAPPWMAKDLGYIAEPLHRISSDIWWAMGVQDFSEVYKNISPNPVAAVPSLHSAYPLIVSLFMIYSFGFRKAGWTVIYPISMWIGVVYLGEHYIFDVVAAALYVFVGFFIYRKQYILHKRIDKQAKK